MICTKCKMDKGEDDFHKDKRSVNGLRSDCKECNKKNAKDYYKKHREKLLEMKKIRYGANKSKYLNTHRDKVKKLYDWYVKTAILNKSTGLFKREDIPLELIKLKRAQLTLYRAIYQ